MISIAAVFVSIAAYDRLASEGTDPAAIFLAVLAGILAAGAVLVAACGRDDL